MQRPDSLDPLPLYLQPQIKLNMSFALGLLPILQVAYIYNNKLSIQTSYLYSSPTFNYLLSLSISLSPAMSQTVFFLSCAEIYFPGSGVP